MILIALLAYIRPHHRHPVIGKISTSSALDSYFLHLKVRKFLALVFHLKCIKSNSIFTNLFLVSFFRLEWS